MRPEIHAYVRMGSSRNTWRNWGRGRRLLGCSAVMFVEDLIQGRWGKYVNMTLFLQTWGHLILTITWGGKYYCPYLSHFWASKSIGWELKLMLVCMQKDLNQGLIKKHMSFPVAHTAFKPSILFICLFTAVKFLKQTDNWKGCSIASDAAELRVKKRVRRNWFSEQSKNINQEAQICINTFLI